MSRTSKRLGLEQRAFSKFATVKSSASLGEPVMPALLMSTSSPVPESATVLTAAATLLQRCQETAATYKAHISCCTDARFVSHYNSTRQTVCWWCADRATPGAHRPRSVPWRQLRVPSLPRRRGLSLVRPPCGKCVTKGNRGRCVGFVSFSKSFSAPHDVPGLQQLL